MSSVICKNDRCTYMSKNGFCKKTFVDITPQGLCNEWFSNDGIPYAQQMSEYIKTVEYTPTIEKEIKETEEEVIGN